MTFVFILCVLSVTLVWARQPTQWLYYLDWANSVIFNHLINMTAELIKDATYKLKHAEKVKDMHSHSITYELGTIAAGIQERFHRMLKIYRKYANMKLFMNYSYTNDEIANAYNVIQGDYNEIRMEKEIFYEIVKKHESTSPTTRFSLPPELYIKNLGRTRRSSPGRGRRLWSPKMEGHFFH